MTPEISSSILRPSAVIEARVLCKVAAWRALDILKIGVFDERVVFSTWEMFH